MIARDIALERFRRALRTFENKVRADAFAGAQPPEDRAALHAEVRSARARVVTAARQLTVAPREEGENTDA